MVFLSALITNEPGDFAELEDVILILPSTDLLLVLIFEVHSLQNPKLSTGISTDDFRVKANRNDLFHSISVYIDNRNGIFTDPLFPTNTSFPTICMDSAPFSTAIFL